MPVLPATTSLVTSAGQALLRLGPTKAKFSTCTHLLAMNATAGPWYAAYPAPRVVDLGRLTPGQVLDLVRNADGGSGQAGKFILVDLRREDHEGGTIRGSINLPAQSLYPIIPRLYSIFRAAGIQTVIWYCGSSLHRGSRAAGWFADHIEDRQEGEMKNVVLDGGIKGWVAAGGKHLEYMDKYDPTKWDKEEQA